MTSAYSLHPQVDVNYDEVRKRIKAGEYRPALSDQELNPMDRISDIWERPPDGHIHVFVGLSCGGASPNISCTVFYDHLGQSEISCQ